MGKLFFTLDEHVIHIYLHISSDLARTTYQRLVNKMFSNQIRRNMVVCVDDMLIKSKE